MFCCGCCEKGNVELRMRTGEPSSGKYESVVDELCELFPSLHRRVNERMFASINVEPLLCVEVESVHSEWEFDHALVAGLILMGNRNLFGILPWAAWSPAALLLVLSYNYTNFMMSGRCWSSSNSCCLFGMWNFLTCQTVNLFRCSPCLLANCS